MPMSPGRSLFQIFPTSGNSQRPLGLKNMKFVITKVVKTDEGFRVFGNFIYDNLRETGLKELHHPKGKFRFEQYDSSKFVEDCCESYE